jgi:hypothetical protein
MGMDVSCKVVLGTPITKDLLFTTERCWNYKDGSCCEEDAKKGRKFCSNCGTEFKQVTVNGLTKQFRNLLEEEGFNTEGGNVDDLDLYDLEMIHNVQSVQGSVDDWDDLVLGVIIGGTESHRWGESSPKPTSWNRIEKAIARIKHMANTMNITNAPINLYPVLYVSV